MKSRNCKIENLLILSFMALMFSCGQGFAIVATYEPDDFADSTDISNAFAGVTLSVVDDFIPSPYGTLSDDKVYSTTPINFSFASTGSRVFGSSCSGFDGQSSPHSEVWLGYTPRLQLKADFSELCNSVSIDFIANDTYDAGVLEAYDMFGTLIEVAVITPLAMGEIGTATIARADYDISYILASGFFDSSLYLDNLSVNRIPEPMTLLLLGAGSLVLRRKK